VTCAYQTTIPPIEPAGIALDIPCSDGNLLAARVYGPSDAPRLVMSHGNGMAIAGYRTFWRPLADEFQVVAFDVRSHGRSGGGASGKHHWTQFVDDMEAVWQTVVDSLGPRHTIGVFHSLSAVAALGHVRRYGKRWDGLLLFDPPLMPPDGHLLQVLHKQEMAFLVERVLRRRRHYRSPDELAEQFSRQPLFRHWRPEAFQDMARAVLKYDALAGGWVLACPPEYEARIYETNIDQGNWLSLPASPSPVKLVCGDPEIDDVQPSAHIGLAAALELGVDYEAVPQATHFLQIEHPQACQAITRAFYRNSLRNRQQTERAREHIGPGVTDP